jgi:hypothetical protein
MARLPAAADSEALPTGRVARLRLAFSMTRQYDPQLVPWVFGPALAVLVVLVLIGVFVGQTVPLAIAGVLGAVAVGFSVFGRRASRAMLAQVEGKPGAAAAVVQAMRGDWRLTPAVQVTRTQDVVHRVVGRPGVVLLGEGAPGRVGQLLVNERRRVQRVAPDTPVYEVQVGDGSGQTELRRLQTKLMRLPRNLKQREVNEVDARLAALRDSGPPIPKGPIPRNLRVPRGRMR